MWEALIAAEQLVNPRVRDDVGEIRLVPAGGAHQRPRRQLGDGRVHAPQSARARASATAATASTTPRAELRTAIRETAHHFARFAADSRDPPRYEDMRVLVSRIDQRFADVGASAGRRAARASSIADSYAAGQPSGAALRAAGANGVVYASVRDPGGECVGAFKPTRGRHPGAGRACKYHWDGVRVARYFDYESGKWVGL